MCIKHHPLPYSHPFKFYYKNYVFLSLDLFELLEDIETIPQSSKEPQRPSIRQNIKQGLSNASRTLWVGF